MDQIQGLVWRAMRYDVLSQALMHIRSAVLTVICRKYAPSGVCLWSTNAASFAAGQSVGFRKERVLVAGLDVQYVLLKRANYTLQLFEERLLINVLNTSRST